MISPASADANSGGGKDVLIAEDNAVNQLLIRQLVLKMGHRPTIVENGRKCVEAWSTHPFSFILMDLQMPEMSGLQAAEAIRQLEKASGGHIPIIAVTANTLPTDREACMRVGMDDFVAKPLRVAHLEAAITRCLGGGSKPLIRFDCALARANGDCARLRSDLETFMHRAHELMAQIEAALCRRDVPAIVSTAQCLRESLCRCAADTPEGIAAGIEHAGRTSDFIGAATGLAELRKHAEALHREIEGYLKSAPAPVLAQKA